MNQNDYWEQFWSSGRIDDYLKYVSAVQISESSADEAAATEGEKTDKVS